MTIAFPQNPTTGQVYSFAGKSWRFDGIGWKAMLPASLKGFTGDEGRPVEFQKSATHLQWRYVGDSLWTNVLALSDIRGIQGDPGRNPEYQKSATHIQWRYVGDTAWIDLVPLSEIKGAAGDAGSKWLSGTTNPAAGTGVNGDYYVNTVSGDVFGPKAAGAWGGAVFNMKPAFATQAEAEAATITDKASSPARVREFVQKFGFSAGFTNTATDLNLKTAGEFWSYDAATTNKPAANTFGRGLTLPGGTGYCTQQAIENGTGKTWVRHQDNGAWGAWRVLVAASTAP